MTPWQHEYFLFEACEEHGLTYAPEVLAAPWSPGWLAERDAIREQLVAEAWGLA